MVRFREPSTAMVQRGSLMLIAFAILLYLLKQLVVDQEIVSGLAVAGVGVLGLGLIGLCLAATLSIINAWYS